MSNQTSCRTKLWRWLSLVVVLTLVGTAASANERYQGRQIVIWSAGGALADAMKDVYIQPFEKDTGAKVRIVEAGFDEALAAIAAQKKAGKVEWDAMSMIDAPVVPRLVNEGLIQKVEVSTIAGLDKLPSNSVSDYGIAVFLASVTASYRQADGVTPLKSVKEFFDPDIKGPRSAGGTASDAQVMCVLALLADGVAVENLAPLDIDRCLSVWGRIKGQVTNWWTTGSEMAQAMIDEQVDYCICFDGRIVQAAKTNPKWTLTHQGGVQFPVYFTYVNGTKNADVLNGFVEYMIDAKRQAEYTKRAGYSAPNPEAINYMPDNLKQFLSVTPKAQAGLTSIPDAVDKALAQQQTAIGEAWIEWLAQ